MFGKRLIEIFEDQKGALDEKRILGFGLVVFAVIYICVIKPGDLSGFLGIAGTGTGLLGIAVAGDQGNLGGPSTPTQAP